VQRLEQLAALIEQDREALLARWRQQVRQLPSAELLDTPALNDHIPDLLDELVHELRLALRKTIPEALLEGTPPNHGRQRQSDGFDIVEVVAEYNILRGCIHELAERNGIALAGAAFQILNRVLDESIGLAVQTFATQQALEVQRRRDEYLAFVAHDLRTPLSAIALAGRLLERRLSGPVDEKTGQVLTTLHRNVRQLQALVENVLKESDHVRTENGVRLERRAFDLWPLVEDVIGDLQPLAETAGTELVNKVPADLAVFADATLLKRVIQNLIANAINYTPRGEVVVAARETATDGTVELAVCDNGAGIPEERLDVIFEKLETDPDREGGTGLGLAIVKSFVEAHGGTVTVESEENSGSIFRFDLPGRSRPGRD
jgi:two-component system phosphate regulon sensor histidine kinase PhoR